jgi:phenylacetate-coenzyme A ligase PaaK-like adenylate-forming protein
MVRVVTGERPVAQAQAHTFLAERTPTEQLLKQTLDYVIERSSYYRTAFAPYDLSDFTLDRFQELPFQTEADFDEHAAEIRCGGTTDYVLLTGGTSHFQKIGFRSQAEYDVFGQAVRGMKQPSNGITIELLSSIHGARAHIPGGEDLLRVPFAHPEHFRLVEGLLTRTAPRTSDLPRIEAVGGTLTRLKLLTTYLQERGHDLTSFKLDRLTTHGWQLTPRWRAMLETAWGCRVTDVYGMSEFDMALSEECADCGYYHFIPAAYSEVIDVRSGRPAAEGTAGVLAMTTLYPFWQLEPRIRFWTNDVLRVGPVCPTTSANGIRFKGRYANCAYDREENEFVLFTTDVTNVLDDFPDVARKEKLNLVPSSSSEECGFLRFSLETRESPDRAITLGVELRYEPTHFPERTGGLRSEIVERLRRASPSLNHAVQRERWKISVEFFRPGGLGGTWIVS